MPSIANTAKALLLDTSMESYAKYARGGYILADVCPACGEDHSSILLIYLEKGAGLICPNTGVEVYAVYS